MKFGPNRIVLERSSDNGQHDGTVDALRFEERAESDVVVPRQALSKDVGFVMQGLTTAAVDDGAQVQPVVEQNFLVLQILVTQNAIFPTDRVGCLLAHRHSRCGFRLARRCSAATAFEINSDNAAIGMAYMCAKLDLLKLAVDER